MAFTNFHQKTPLRFLSLICHMISLIGWPIPLHICFEIFSKQLSNVEILIYHFYKNIQLSSKFYSLGTLINSVHAFFYRHYKGLHQMHKDLVLCSRKILVIREVAESRTAGIFIRDTACFHCDSMNCDSQFNESQ